MAEIIWTRRALTALDEIAQRIALDNPAAAERLVQRLVERIERLRRFPALGSRVREALHLPHRQLVVAPCRIFYRAEKQRILIIFILRGERQFHRHFLTPTER